MPGLGTREKKRGRPILEEGEVEGELSWGLEASWMIVRRLLRCQLSVMGLCPGALEAGSYLQCV